MARSPADPTPPPPSPAEALRQLRSLPRPEANDRTPEGAILCLEEAYRRRDLEAAVRCKHFPLEATLLLQEAAPHLAADAAARTRTAQMLEQAFRQELSARWPEMAGVESFFVERHVVSPDLVVIREIHRLPDGTLGEAHLRVGRTSEGWRVLNPVRGASAG